MSLHEFISQQARERSLPKWTTRAMHIAVNHFSKHLGREPGLGDLTDENIKAFTALDYELHAGRLWKLARWAAVDAKQAAAIVKP